MKYDYGNQGRGLSFEHYNFYDSLIKMNKSEHTIIYFPFDEIMISLGRDLMNKKLKKDVVNEQPDLCFFFLYSDEIAQETIREITNTSSATTFNWFADDHWRFDNFSRHWAPLFHWVSTTDSLAPAKYEKMGFTYILKTQWAANHFLYKPDLDRAQSYEITFVGRPHSNRREIMRKLKVCGVDVRCFGNGWPHGRVDQDEMIALFSHSRINLNLTKSSGFVSFKSLVKFFMQKRANGTCHLASPLKWRDNIVSLTHMSREQIKGRNFEIPGCGGFLLTSDADNLSEYYHEGSEIVIYKNFNDLVDKIRYYQTHEDERRTIAQAGYQRTLREHTYEKRFNDLFTRMGLQK